MPVRYLLLILASAPLAGCMLPRPQFAPDLSQYCKLSPDGPGAESDLFITLRRPDCSGVTALTNFRSESPRYASITTGRITFHDPEMWLAELNRRAGGSPDVTPLLYIHGYNTDNGEALARTRLIAAAAGVPRGPVVALTWPSYASKRAYYWDEANAEWARGGAAAVLSTLTARVPKLMIVAHSMGNRLALGSVEALDPATRANKIQRLVMASPDVDRESTKLALGELGKTIKTTVYVSLKDQALSGSWRGHGYPRAGDFSWWVSGRQPFYAFAWLPNVEVIDTTEVDSRSLLRLNIGHTAFVSTRAGRADLCRLARGMDGGRPGLRPLLGQLNYYALENVAAGDGCDQP